MFPVLALRPCGVVVAEKRLHRNSAVCHVSLQHDTRLEAIGTEVFYHQDDNQGEQQEPG
jgi:hypothetical protein